MRYLRGIYLNMWGIWEVLLRSNSHSRNGSWPLFNLKTLNHPLVFSEHYHNHQTSIRFLHNLFRHFVDIKTILFAALFDLFKKQLIASNVIILHHVHHGVTPRDMTSHHVQHGVTPRDMTSHHVTWRRTTWNMTSHHVPLTRQCSRK